MTIEHGGAANLAETQRAGQAATIAAALGIPEREFTPRVREAVMALTHEVELLRRELAQARSRMEDIARAADQDMLLPILNRRAFVREISRSIALAARYGTPSSLLYFDLDGFKTLNDTLGHAAGDALLKHFAAFLVSQVRDSDIVARIGGDEFGVILAHVTLEQARRKAAMLREELRANPPSWHGRPVPLNVSCGAYELRAGQSVDVAMAGADQAMYSQKPHRATP